MPRRESLNSLPSNVGQSHRQRRLVQVDWRDGGEGHWKVTEGPEKGRPSVYKNFLETLVNMTKSGDPAKDLKVDVLHFRLGEEKAIPATQVTSS